MLVQADGEAVVHAVGHRLQFLPVLFTQELGFPAQALHQFGVVGQGVAQFLFARLHLREAAGDFFGVRFLFLQIGLQGVDGLVFLVQLLLAAVQTVAVGLAAKDDDNQQRHRHGEAYQDDVVPLPADAGMVFGELVVGILLFDFRHLGGHLLAGSRRLVMEQGVGRPGGKVGSGW